MQAYTETAPGLCTTACNPKMMKFHCKSRVLKETCEAYRHYLQYIEADLGVALNPDNLSVEIIEKEQTHV